MSQTKSQEKTKKEVKKDLKDLKKDGEDVKDSLVDLAAEKVQQTKADINSADPTKEDAKSLGNKVYARGKDLAQEGQDALHQFKKDHLEELERLEENGKSLWNQLVKYVNRVVNDASAAVSKLTLQARTELQNPAVVGQLVVGIAAAAAGYVAFVERKHRINTDSKAVLGIHASIITGLVLLDGFVFSRAYKKYQK